MVVLQHPAALWLLAIVVPLLGLLYWVWRRAQIPVLRRRVLIALSLVGLTCLVLALAGPYRVRPQARGTAVFLVDLSSSVSDRQLDLAADQVRARVLDLDGRTSWQVVGFAARPVQLTGGLKDLDPGALPALRRPTGPAAVVPDADVLEATDLGAALLYARAQIGQQGRITLLTDGLETRGEAEPAALGLDSQGIGLEVIPLDLDADPEVVLTAVEAPSPVQEGQNARVRITVETTADGPVLIEALHLETDERQTVTKALSSGAHVLELPLDTRQADVASYRVTVSSDRDTRTDNNERLLSVPILPRPVVAVLATDAGAVTTLGQWLGDQARVMRWTWDEPAAGTPTLDQIDLLILADAEPDQVTGDRFTRLRDQVRQGMGLWVLPGPGLIRHALLTEGSALADLLPVRPLQYGKQSNPNTTVVFILDTSGSMSGARIQLAKEIARMAISHLNEHDKVGIVEFYGAKRWAAPIQSAANRLDINRALNRLTAGGGTIILPALEEAHYALLNTSSTTKHVVVISDAGVEGADYESLLRKISRDNIAVSTILVGPAAHTGFMADLSQWGRGAFFHAGDRFRLPDLNFKSVQNKSGAPRQQNDGPVVSVFAASLLSGVLPGTMDPPAATLAASPRPAAQVPLTLANGQPLLSLWQYGLGQVAFWGADLLHGDAGGQPWADLVANQCRKLYRPVDPDWAIACQQVHDTVRFTVTARDPAAAQPGPLALIHNGQVAETLPMVRVDGRRWAAQARDLAAGPYRVTLNTEQGEALARAAFAVTHTPELSASRSDVNLLRRLESAAGKPAISGPPLRTQDLRAVALILALLCLLAHVVLRRLPQGRLGRLVRPWIWLLVLVPALPSRAAEDPNRTYVLSRLDGRSEAAPTADPVLALVCGDMDRATEIRDPAQASGFAATLQRGYALYRVQRYTAAYEAFQRAMPLAETEEDQKYVLAWVLLTADKAGHLADLEQTLVRAGEPIAPYQVKGLLLAYGLQGDLTRAMALHDRVHDTPSLGEDFRLEITREILNLASVSGKANEARSLLEQALTHTSDPGMGVGLVKLHLLNGDRDLGRAELDRLVRGNTRPASLLFLAEQAERMAFHGLALQVAADVMANHPDYAYDAGLFRVQATMRRGQPDEAAVRLREMADRLPLNDKQRFEIAQVYEQLGHYPEAMALYQGLVERTGAHDVLMRLAWLHEKARDLDQAYATWHTLWTQCEQEHLLVQIQPRLLDLAARTGRLAALAVQLEEDLETRGADPKALGLLIDLYVSVGDALSAVELAKQHYGQDTVESLIQQQRITLRCHEFGRCHRILQRLLEVDPANASTYLQQLAVIALERGHERDALAAAQAIAQAQDADLIDAEYSAGVLAMMGRAAEAARIYRDLLQDEPDNAELWLLWANTAQEAGQSQEAVERLTRLLDETASDDVFTVAVDGLLNLQADQETLKTALAGILLRLARAPDKVHLYSLAVDVLEELKTARLSARDLLLLAAPYAPQRRAAFIREAQEHCVRARDLQGQLDLGILLVTMDYQLPPAFYMDLGKQFLERGRESTAQLLFHYKGLLNDNPSLGVEVANYYDRYGRFDKAAAMIRECLCSTPDDLVLLTRSASYEEVTGNLPLAFKHYRRLYELSLGAMSLESGPTNKAESVSRRRQQVNAGDRYSFMAMQGLLVTDNPQTPLSDLCSQWSEQILASVQEKASLSALMAQHWRDYDALCAASGQVEQADRTASRILEVCNDPDLRPDLVQNRCTWGLYPAALTWAKDLDRSQWPQTLQAWADAHAPEGPSQAANLVDSLVRAWVLGRDEEAQRLARRLSEGPISDTDLTRQTALVSAYVLQDQDLVRRVVARSLQDAASGQADQQQSRPQALGRVAWTVLPPADRRWLAREMETAFGTQPGLAHVIELAKIQTGLQGDYRASQAATSSLVERLRYTDPNQRLAVLAEAVKTHPEAQRKAFLWTTLADMDFPLTDAEVQAVARMFEAQPPAVLTATQTLSVPRHSPIPSLWLALAEGLLKDLPGHPGVNAAAALGRLAAGQADQAAALISAVVDPWIEQKEIAYGSTGTLQDLIGVLPIPALNGVLEDVRMVQEVMGPTVQGHLLEALIHQRQGRLALARSSMQKAYALQPDNREISRRIKDLYSDTGHYRDLAALMAGHLYATGQGTSLQWTTLSGLYLQCGQLPEALRATAQDTVEIIRNRSYLFLYHEAGQTAALQQALRKFYVDCRASQFSTYLRWPRPDSPGGILGLESPLVSTACVSSLLGQDDGLAEDLPRYWRALQPGDRDMGNMAQGLAAIYTRGGRTAQVLADLQGQEQAGTAQVPKAQALRRSLVTQATAQMPADQIDALTRRTEAAQWDTWRWIAAAYGRAGQTDKARRAYRWLCLNEWVTGANQEDLFADLEAWHAIDPQAGSLLEPGLAPNPFVPFSAPFEARRLDWLVRTGPDRDLTAEVRGLEGRFQGPGPLEAPALREALMGCALHHDDLAGYTRHLEVLLSTLDSLYNPGYVVRFPNLAAACKHRDRVDRFLAHSRTAIEQALAAGRLSGPAAMPHLAMLAVAFYENKNLSASKAICDTMGTLVTEPSQKALWLVDALERCGQPAQAGALLETLSRDGLVPRTRSRPRRAQDLSRKDVP